MDKSKLRAFAEKIYAHMTEKQKEAAHQFLIDELTYEEFVKRFHSDGKQQATEAECTE